MILLIVLPALTAGVAGAAIRDGRTARTGLEKIINSLTLSLILAPGRRRARGKYRGIGAVIYVGQGRIGPRRAPASPPKPGPEPSISPPLAAPEWRP
jgi:hypothetical protein